MRTKTLLLLVLSTFSGLNAFAAPLPPEFTATYDVTKGFFKIGEAKRSLKKQDDKWVYTSVSKTTGFIGSILSTKIIQSTTFEMKDGLIRPLKYAYNKNKTEHVVRQNYDWEKKQVFSQSGEKLHIYDIPDKVQDQSIYQLSLMLDVADGNRDLTYHVAENVRLMNYQIKGAREEKIKSIFGKIKTVAVQIKAKRNKTTIWFAPKYHFMPIKIEFEEDGTTFLAKLTKLEGL